ncbi:hypothetical protein [Dyadobacter koreensis]|uniref:hypothetical protein n=1 Tax=Dyadobacter koreensis TaxID=408657 RepID=UPI000B851988|nr:hypothetical protein [Dyadobacter koreensis]
MTAIFMAGVSFCTAGSRQGKETYKLVLCGWIARWEKSGFDQGVLKPFSALICIFMQITRETRERIKYEQPYACGRSALGRAFSRVCFAFRKSGQAECCAAGGKIIT